MKKILLLLIVTVSLISYSNAQSVQPTYLKPDRQISATVASTNATVNYVTVSSIASKVKGFQAVVTKTSGTVAGTVLLQGTIDGATWVDCNTDTLTLVNQTTNSKVWPITSTIYNSYRVKYTSTSGTQVSAIQLAYVRRPDE